MKKVSIKEFISKWISKDIGYGELVMKEGILVGGSFLGGRFFPLPFIHMMKVKKL